MKRLSFKHRLLSVILRIPPALALALTASLLVNGIQNTLAAGEFTATKTDSLFLDMNGNAQVNTGDTIQYTVDITNVSLTEQLAVLFIDTIDANTTLVAGSVHTTPIARNDSGYSTVGNVLLTVPPGSGVLVNDDDPDGTGPVAVSGCGADLIAPFTCASTNSGDVSLNADGSFTYNPAPGFSGADSFTYTIADSDNATDTATVSITVGTPVWFINNTAVGFGDGRSGTPFNSITSFDLLAADEAGDYIFIDTGSGAYTGTLTLLNNQQLIGEGVGLTVSPNLSIAAGTRPTIANIVLASGNTVRGLNVTTNTGTGVSGSSVGALTINNVSVNNTGGIGVSLSGGSSAMAVTFDSVSSSGGANGIVLTNNSGSFTSNGGTIDPTTGHGIAVSNTGVGPLNFTLSNSTITAAPSGFDGINFNLPGSGSFGIITIQNNTISNNGYAGIGASIQGTGTITKINVGGNSGNNTFTNNQYGVILTASDTANVDFDIRNNTMTGTNFQVGIFANDSTPNNGSGATLEGYIRGNTITVNPTLINTSGINVISTGDGNITMEINSNTVNNFGDVGIIIESKAGMGDVHARVVNNTASTISTTSYAGMFLRSGNNTAGETSLLCVNLVGNNISGGSAGLADYVLDRYVTPTTFQIQGLAPSPAIALQAQTFVIGTDTAPPATASVDTGSYLNATCSTVSFAALPSQTDLASELEKTSAAAADQTPVWQEALTSLENTASSWTRDLISSLGVSSARASGETVNISLGDMDPSQAVTITFQVTVDNSVSASQVSNQGTISSSTVSSHLTDDPAVGGTSDATITPLQDLIAPDTTITSQPSNPSSSSFASFTFSGTDNVTPSGSLTFQCSMDGGAFSACTSPYTSGVLTDGSHTFRVQAVDAGGNVDGTPASYTWTVDTTSPPAPVVLTPANGSFTSDTTPTVTGIGEPGATITLYVDGAPNATGTADGSGNWSITVSSALSNGTHTVRARANDNVGNTSPDSNTNTFTVDGIAPDTTITSNPTNPSADTTPSFTFTGNDGAGVGGVTFECRLDTGTFTACTSPFTTPVLSDGSYTFEVRATDALGNTDTTPASYTWSVDTGAPDTSITGQPGNPSSNQTPAFTFTSTDLGATFECRLDVGVFAACISPFTTPALVDGSHTFEVRSEDALGNTDPTPASYTWTVDTIRPIPTLTLSGSNPTFTSPINVIATFNEPVTGFGDSALDVTLSSSAGVVSAVITEIAPTDGTTYQIAISGMTSTGTVTVSIPVSAASDAAGNGNDPIPGLVINYIHDTTAPSVTVEQSAGQSDPTSSAPILFTATFNEPIDTATFTAADITLTSTAGTVSANVTEVAPNNGTTFEIQVTGMTTSGTVTASIIAGVVKDLGSNDNLASTSADNVVTYDTTSPSVITTTLQASYNSTGPGYFMVYFSEEVNNPAGNADPDDVTNPANYLLIEKGANGTTDTVSCLGGVIADDVQVSVASVDYFTPPPSAKVNLAAPLATGNYRLFICGTTSIVDLTLTPLGGFPGSDYTFDFVVTTTGNTPQDPEEGGMKVSASALPNTGFSPNKITVLPPQPASAAYAELGDLSLEIPSLKVKSTIVGVPQLSSGDWDVSWLGNNTGWLNGTAFPSWNGNSVLTAHVTNANGLDGPFSALKSLKYGDQIILHMGGVKYVYEIRESKLALPYATNFAFQSLQDHSYLTLITCQGYNPITETYRFRRVVRAVLIEVK